MYVSMVDVVSYVWVQFSTNDNERARVRLWFMLTLCMNFVLQRLHRHLTSKLEVSQIPDPLHFPTTPSEWSLRCATNALFYAGELVTAAAAAAEIELDAGCC
jgi:hypothetical protein